MSKDASKNTEPMDEELKDKVPETPETETVPETEAAAPAPEPTAEEKLQAQLSELNDRYLRTLAEYDNYRKRTAKEKEAIYPEAKASTLASMLPVLDNFERAMAAKADADAFFEGVEKIYKQLLETMTKMGVEEIPALGETFDPEKHHAVMQAEATEDYPAGTVCEVFQKGYRAGEKVLRYSMVKVAQ